MPIIETAHTRLDARQVLVVFLLCLFPSMAIVYFPITNYDVNDSATGGKEGDAVQYIKMFRGDPLTEVRRPFRYRILTPYLARHVPFLPESISRFYDITPAKVVNFKFGMVNFLALTLTSFFIFIFCRMLNFSAMESLVGSYLFLTSFHVINFTGLPLVDPLAYLFLIGGTILILQHRHLLLGLTFFAGIFAKETTVLLVLLIFFFENERSVKIKQAAACLPGLAAYLIFRFFLLPASIASPPPLAWTLQIIRHVLRPGEHWTWLGIQALISFGILWILAAHGWMLIKNRRNDPLFRLSFVVPFVLVAPFLIGSNVARIWVLAFPAIIPLSLLSLRSLLKLPQTSQN